MAFRSRKSVRLERTLALAAILQLVIASIAIAIASPQTTPIKKPNEYSPIARAIALFGEYHITYLDNGYYSSKDITRELKHYATLCSMADNMEAGASMKKILEMVNDVKRARLGVRAITLGEEEAKQLLDWNVVTERDLAELQPVLLNKCALGPGAYIHFTSSSVSSKTTRT